MDRIDGEDKGRSNPEQIVEGYVSSATVHGIAKIYEAKSLKSKYFWTIAFLIFFANLLYNTVKLVEKYSQHDVRVEVRTVEDRPATFPKITICNKDPFGVNSDLDFGKEDFKLQGFNDRPLRENDIIKVLKLLKGLDNTSSVSYLQYNIIGCQFNLRNCSEQDFDIYESHMLGRCHVFNRNGTRHQTRPGYPYGLRLQIFVNQDGYLSSPLYEGDAGLTMSTTSPDIPYLDATDAVLLESGKRNRLSMKRVGAKRLKKPFHDNCTDGEGISQKLLYPGKYSTSFCLLSCFILEQYKFCKFIDPFIQQDLPKEIRFPTLTNLSDYSCITEFEKKFENANIYCDCPPSCEEESYERFMSQSVWPSYTTAKKMLGKLKSKEPKIYSNKSIDFIYHNFLMLEIYLSDFAVKMTIQQPAYDWNSLASDLGGQLGLWLGASVFSLFEFSAFIVDLIIHKWYALEQEKLKKAVDCKNQIKTK